MRLLHAGGFEVLEDHLGEVCLAPYAALCSFGGIDQLVVLVDAQHAVRAEALDGERPSDADLLLVRVGLVVEVLELGLGGDGGVDLLLPGDACLPPFGVQFGRSLGPRIDGAFRQSLEGIVSFQVVVNGLEPFCKLR